MQRPFLTQAAIALLLTGCAGMAQAQSDAPQLAKLEAPAEGAPAAAPADADIPVRETPAGNYLSGRHAQQVHDWGTAGTYLSKVLDADPANADLQKRAMILAAGSGNIDKAMKMAKTLQNDPETGSLAHLFLSLEAFKRKDYAAAAELIKSVPKGSFSDFINPLLHSWALAGQGKMPTAELSTNPLQAFHAVLIAHYLKQDDKASAILGKAIADDKISPQNLNQIADLYASIGLKKEAANLYKKILPQMPEEAMVAEKIAALKDGKLPDGVEPFQGVGSPQEGVAEALLDMARILYSEYSDDSARVFGQMSLYLNPDLTETKILLASIAARNERYDEAIDYYLQIDPSDESDAPILLNAAELMSQAGRIKDAMALLGRMATQNNNIDARILMGDIYRRAEKFKDSLEQYNLAIQQLNGKVPPEYWNLLYARGMVLERLGMWKEAEQDLEAALIYQPDHPYILNYLGYAWADQGMNLDKALEMVRKAAGLQPSDGYIADSLGWVLYRMARYQDSVAPLEQAVQLLPYDPLINDHLGDAYWRVGRKLEARFQWQRALNATKDPAFAKAMKTKLDEGIKEAAPPAKQVKAVAEAEKPATVQAR